jgi:hypothetical protein
MVEKVYWKTTVFYRGRNVFCCEVSKEYDFCKVTDGIIFVRKRDGIVVLRVLFVRH